jgi:hypothetical protein
MIQLLVKMLPEEQYNSIFPPYGGFLSSLQAFESLIPGKAHNPCLKTRKQMPARKMAPDEEKRNSS